MKTKSILSFLILFWMLACSDDGPYITFNNHTQTEGVTLGAEQGSEEKLSFSSNLPWKAIDDADWLIIEPETGEAGDREVILRAESENRTGEPRSATVTLASTEIAQTITVTQEAGRYAQMEKDTIQVGKTGGAVEVRFTTNMAAEEYVFYRNANWISRLSQSSASENGEIEVTLQLMIAPNLLSLDRVGYFLIANAAQGSSDNPFATLTIIQSGTLENTVNSSTDFSRDQTTRLLHEATQGQGIPIVLMGDGFIDTDIENGHYDEVMEKAFDNLFSEEPIRSLVDYFDVHIVYAVSPDQGIGLSRQTALSSYMAGGSSTQITVDEQAAINYTQCVEGIDMENTLAVVILNASEHAGTTYFRFSNNLGEISEYAIALCPIIDNLESEQFRQVLTHEAIGHGFAKLGDEYSYPTYGQIPQSEVNDIKDMQALGWMRNLDFTADPSAILWSSFLSDMRYDSEGLGVFEGGDSYPIGIYRPSEESMMNSNQSGFNAPSRQAIYDKVMLLGEGREATYEEFTSFDLQRSRTAQTKAAPSTSDDLWIPFAKSRIGHITIGENGYVDKFHTKIPQSTPSSSLP